MDKETTYGQNSFIRIAMLENAIEAQLVSSILNEQQIPHHIRSHHDTAYDGLFQTQKGWGEVQAPISFRAQIENILAEIRNNTTMDSSIS